jgi:pimeloyl-ACP methyl ester carboxylesterase
VEKIVKFSNRNGLQLNGILHEPDKEAKDIAILFVHSGVQGRSGNTNQYVTYARELAKNGYLCFRFDPQGLGDSEGLIEPLEMRDFYGSIQSGRFVNDTIDAIDVIKKQTGAEKVVLLGLCGGSITALLAAELYPSISGLILLSAPIMLDGSKDNFDHKIPKDIAKLHLTAYLYKLIKPKYWLRALTFKSDYTTIFNYLKALLGDKRKSNKGSTGKPTDKVSVGVVNDKFYKAYDACKGNMNVIWFYGSNDSFYYHFKEHFQDLDLMDRNDEFLLVENANHMFTLIEWQNEICARTLKWLNSQCK